MSFYLYERKYTKISRFYLSEVVELGTSDFIWWLVQKNQYSATTNEVRSDRHLLISVISYFMGIRTSAKVPSSGQVGLFVFEKKIDSIALFDRGEFETIFYYRPYEMHVPYDYTFENILYTVCKGLRVTSHSSAVCASTLDQMTTRGRIRTIFVYFTKQTKLSRGYQIFPKNKITHAHIQSK